MTTVKTSIEVQVPRVPNFLSLIGVDTPRSIAEFTEEELRDVAARWTEHLIERAQVIRKQSQKHKPK